MASMNERFSMHFSTMIDLRLTQLDTLTETMPGDSREDNKEMREWPDIVPHICHLSVEYIVK